jgi:hypothetical protein
MPRGDRTGPAGVGPMTGRGMGVCAGNTTRGGFGRGCGRGVGMRNRFATSNSSAQRTEISALKEQMTRIEQLLEIRQVQS